MKMKVVNRNLCFHDFSIIKELVYSNIYPLMLYKRNKDVLLKFIKHIVIGDSSLYMRPWRELLLLNLIGENFK